MLANTKYISNDTTLPYALSYFVCSEGRSDQAVRAGGRRAVFLPLQELCPLRPLLGKPDRKRSITVTTQSLLPVLIWILFELLELTLA